jgi:pSer/pThr/pTyr-binding forkhead associated (FHA) protein
VPITRGVRQTAFPACPGYFALHCRVARNSGYWVRDLNSTNKTYLNDRPVVEARLKDGDFITVGGTVVQFTQEKDVDHAAQSEFFDLVTHDQLTA